MISVLVSVSLCLCQYFYLYLPCRTDEEKTRYTGALCGLGWDVSSDESDSAFPGHDMEIIFDWSFDLHDLQLVSAAYFCIVSLKMQRPVSL